jgi:hypothetical protein
VAQEAAADVDDQRVAVGVAGQRRNGAAKADVKSAPAGAAQ